MAELEIRIEGLEEMIGRLKGLVDTVRSEALMGAVRAGAEVVRGDAARRAPVDLGTLQNSIAIEELENTGDRASVAVGPDRSAPYGKYVEYGTGVFAERGGRQTPWVYFYEGSKGPHGFRTTTGSRPQPFLRPAFDENREKISQVAGEALQRHLASRS